MRNVFLSYRRADSGHGTGRLYDNLVKRLGGEHVFRDVDSIPLPLVADRSQSVGIGQCIGGDEDLVRLERDVLAAQLERSTRRL